jgi:Tol biopolymer transport system component
VGVLAIACTGSDTARPTTPPPTGTGSPSVTASPTPTPSGPPTPIVLTGRLVFSYQLDDNIDIYVMDLPEGTLHRLTTDPEPDFSPTWSPDGSRIAFRSQRDGNDEVYVMDADGGRQRNLTNDPASDYSPAWSPKGDAIAFATTREDPANDVWLMDPDGDHPRPLVEQGGIDEYPSWSPDGSRLAFECTLGRILASRVGDFEVCVVGADGTGLARVTDSPGTSGPTSWSPDGSMIAFGSSRDYAPGDVSYCGDLFVMRPDGTGVTKLTDGTASNCLSSWSSDDYLFYSSDRARSDASPNDLWVMDPDGTNGTLVSPFPGVKADPQFLSAR